MPSTAAAESRQVGLATAVMAADETRKGRGVDAVATSDTAGETCTPICSQTMESSTAADEKDTRVYAQSVDISAEGADCKRGARFPSPASATPAERANIKRVKSMKGNLTRETRRSDNSLTTLHHLKEEMESKHGEILALQDKLQGAKTALLNFMQVSSGTGLQSK